MPPDQSSEGGFVAAFDETAQQFDVATVHPKVLFFEGKKDNIEVEVAIQ